MRKGKNTIAILLWYFGKDGFSHNSSGLAAITFNCDALNLYSDDTWEARLDNAFENTSAPHPNYRLSESNIRFDARIHDFGWIKSESLDTCFEKAKLAGPAESFPWNRLIKRPIPLWKDYGLKSYVSQYNFPLKSKGDTICCKTPYNEQITPYIKIEAKEGVEIEVFTNHYRGGGAYNVRAEYVTKKGVQEYESLSWMNGEEVYYIIPKGIEILDLKYRETGFDTEVSGEFKCSDPFFNSLWQKSVRTLYVTMRDTYMDCPDRERAQWWGDAVIESGETFYSLDIPAHLLIRKAIMELIGWQRSDSTFFSPIPAGN